MHSTMNKKPIVCSISYQQKEAPRLFAMEHYLMDHFGFNRSQLHKQLIRDKYRTMTLRDD
jgi:hypothetical protein